MRESEGVKGGREQENDERERGSQRETGATHGPHHYQPGD